MPNLRTPRYFELAWKVRNNIDECGIRLDLNCPCDRAILDECGLTPSEAFEFLSLWDAINLTDEPTTRFTVDQY